MKCVTDIGIEFCNNLNDLSCDVLSKSTESFLLQLIVELVTTTATRMEVVMFVHVTAISQWRDRRRVCAVRARRWQTSREAPTAPSAKVVTARVFSPREPLLAIVCSFIAWSSFSSNMFIVTFLAVDFIACLAESISYCVSFVMSCSLCVFRPSVRR